MWDIVPEHTQRRATHLAPFPADLCRIPMLASCRADGVVLDPFCGTGTTMSVTSPLGRRSVGVALAEAYLAEGGLEVNAESFVAREGLEIIVTSPEAAARHLRRRPRSSWSSQASRSAEVAVTDFGQAVDPKG